MTMQSAKCKVQKGKAGSLLFALCTLIWSSACVPLPPEMLPQAPGSGQAAASYPDIEPGGVSFSSLHFGLRGYNEVDLRAISSVAEDVFNKIGTDTGLYSYLAGHTFTIVVYKDQAEYATKTKQTSPLRAIAAGEAIYTYPGPDLDPMLAHQLAHLVFASYMGAKTSSLNWLNEGLAMHEEIQRMNGNERVVYQTTQNNKLRAERQPFSQMAFFVGSAEERRRQDVWYLQVESVTSFLMRQGSTLAFAAFLNQLRNGSDVEHALNDNYSGKFRGWADFETAWQASL